VILELNMLRSNPAGYAAIVEAYAGYYRGSILQFPGEPGIQTSEGLPAVSELARLLRRSGPLPLLAPSQGLSRAARAHADDQGPRGATGHTGSDGSDMGQRLKRQGTWNRTAGEKIDYGSDRARLIVLSLLVDDGVQGRGHRANIMNPEFRVIGLAVGPHRVYGSMCVMDFAAAFQDRPDK
jgi:uncharacterized protein YkwD